MKMTLPLMVGWKPLRTLKLCSWDGEEHGMLGSTAWGERADGGGAAHHDCPRASFTNRQHRIYMPREHDVASHVHEGARVRLELR